MSKRAKKILGARLSLAAFSFGYAQNVQAQSCVVLPTCEELGYTDIAARCENGELLKCPFDESKVFCRVAKACTPNACSGYTLSSCPENGNCSTCDKVNDDCSSAGTKYKLDSCKSGYEPSGDTCKPACGSEYKYDCPALGATAPSWATCGGLSTTCECSTGNHWSPSTEQCKINQYELEICSGIVSYSPWDLGSGSYSNDLGLTVYIDGKSAGYVESLDIYSIPAYGNGSYWDPADPQWSCKTFNVSGNSKVEIEYYFNADVPMVGNYPCYYFSGNISSNWVNNTGTGAIEPYWTCKKITGDRGRYVLQEFYMDNIIWEDNDVQKLRIELNYEGTSNVSPECRDAWQAYYCN